MEKLTRHSIQWFYNLLDKGECETLDFKEQLEGKNNNMQTVNNHIYSNLYLNPFAVAFAKFQTSAYGFCMQSSIQLHTDLYKHCKEKLIHYQLHTTISSLQSSLQKHQLSSCLPKTLSLQFSLQLQTLLQTLCKEQTSVYLLFTKIPLAIN